MKGAFASLLLSALACLAQPALAHSTSIAYLQAEGRGDGDIRLQLRVALRDLDALLDLDADADGRLTWGEVEERAADIGRLTRAGLRVTTGEAPCELTAGRPGFVRLDDLGYAQLDVRASCRAGSAIRLHYRILAGVDASHRALFTLAGDPAPRLLAPGATVELGTGGDAGAARDWRAFFADGVAHILGGADHVLFLVGLLLPAVLERRGGVWVARGDLRRALLGVMWIATAFTLAHSLTLGVASFGLLRVPSRVIEPLIAATVLITALNNLYPLVTRRLAWAAFAFGLIHGFGFAEALVPLGLAPLEMAGALLGFNLGVEAGQLLIVAAVFSLLASVRDWRAYQYWVLRGGSALLALVACGWLLERVLDVRLLS